MNFQSGCLLSLPYYHRSLREFCKNKSEEIHDSYCSHCNRQDIASTLNNNNFDKSKLLKREVKVFYSFNQDQIEPNGEEEIYR